MTDARRFSIESDAFSVAAADTSAFLASSSPNSISNAVAGVQPASFAVLNPLSRPNAARKASSRGTPAQPIQTSSLPSVSRSDFEPYLNEIRPEWTRAQKRASLTGKGKEPEGGLFRQRNLASSASSIVPLPPLDIVPDIFSDENFDLANPRTFDAVTRGAVPNGDNGPSLGDTAADQILQEKLSHYLDTVELHLTREISLRSASFFSALSNLQSLHSQSAQALERIASLKKELQDIDAATPQTGLAAVRAGLKRRRLESVTRGIDRIRELEKAVNQASQLANAGEWEGVLGLVEEVEGAIAPPETRDALGISHRPAMNGDGALQLHRLKALKGLPTRLARLRSQVAKSLQAEAITVLTNEFEDAVSAYRPASGPPPSWDPKLKELARRRTMNRIRPIVRGLLRCGWSAIENIVTSWKTSLAKEIRQYVRADLPDDIADADESLEGPSASLPKSLTLSKTLAAYSHHDFMTLARKTMTRLAAATEVASTHSSVLLELIDEVASPESTDAKAALAMELGDVVHASAELANLRFSKIIGARHDEHLKLSLPEFVEVFNESWSFVVQCETACQRMIVGLRGVLVGQAKAFLQAFHQARVSQSAKDVEVEQWVPADVPIDVQVIVEDIVGGAVMDPKTFLLAQAKDADGGNKNEANGSTAKHLVIEERKYFAVLASSKALQALAEYIRMVLNLPLLATDAMSRIIEFLKARGLGCFRKGLSHLTHAQQFNSRTCQVVLGAGAMRSAGLKNITAKNLALASQALSIMIALIPYVREALRRHLSSKQATMLTEFDKLKRDYQEHQYEIHAKFVSIMSDRLAVHCKTLQSIDWATEDDKTPKKYMESLVKETATLHKVLVRFLPTASVDQITGQVLKDIFAKLSEEFDKIVLHDIDAKARLLRDAQYLRIEVAGLKGLTITLPGTVRFYILYERVSESLQLLEDLVSAKTTTIAPPKPPTPPRDPSPPPVVEPIPEPAVATSPLAVKTSPEIPSGPVAADVTRSASSTAMKNRLAGLFGKRGNTIGPGPTSPVLDAPARSSVDSGSSGERPRDVSRGSMLADRLAALAGSPSRSTEALPQPEIDEAVEEVLVAVSQDALHQTEAEDVTEDTAPTTHEASEPAIEGIEQPAEANELHESLEAPVDQHSAPLNGTEHASVEPLDIQETQQPSIVADVTQEALNAADEAPSISTQADETSFSAKETTTVEPTLPSELRGDAAEPEVAETERHADGSLD